jgi:hypothetical protein
MKIKVIIIGVCFLVLAISPLAVSVDTNNRYCYEHLYDDIKAVGIPGEKAIKSDISLSKMNPRYSNIGTDLQITSSEFDDSHPSIDIDINGNPLLLYHSRENFFSSILFVQRSIDGGLTWPEDWIFFWEWEDYTTINPDINFVDGVRAFAVHEIEEQEPILYFHDYENIEDPDTWAIYYFDRSNAATYVFETAVAANKSGRVALGSLQDYQGDDYYEDTLLITWDANNFDDDTADGGVYWLNRDSDGRPIPYSNLCADSDEKTYFVFEREVENGFRQIYTAYCRIDENTLYSDWRQSSVSTSNRYNSTYPDVSVTGKKAYATFMSDRYGNQDIFVAVTTTGSFWQKYQVTDTAEDEYYPVINADGDTATVLFMRDENLYKTSSEDGGKTWTTPEQVNDESNTVTQEYQNSDIVSTYGVWADYRNGNNDLYFDEVGSAAILTIDEIKGGLGIEVTISNVGNAPAENIFWSLDLDGGFLLIGGHTEGEVTILPGASVTVKSDLVFGIGRVGITATCLDSTKTGSGFVLGPFVLGVE